LLKKSIPIRTFAEGDEARPGFFEVDLVSPDGGNPKGDFIQSLNFTDIATGWVEMVAVKNKAQRWVFAGIETIKERLPFSILGLDSDNGAKTPYRRVLASPPIEDEIKMWLLLKNREKK